MKTSHIIRQLAVAALVLATSFTFAQRSSFGKQAHNQIAIGVSELVTGAGAGTLTSANISYINRMHRVDLGILTQNDHATTNGASLRYQYALCRTTITTLSVHTSVSYMHQAQLSDRLNAFCHSEPQNDNQILAGNYETFNTTEAYAGLGIAFRLSGFAIEASLGVGGYTSTINGTDYRDNRYLRPDNAMVLSAQVGISYTLPLAF